MSFPQLHPEISGENKQIIFTVPNSKVIRKITADGDSDDNLHRRTSARALSSRVKELASVLSHLKVNVSFIEGRNELEMKVLAPPRQPGSVSAPSIANSHHLVSSGAVNIQYNYTDKSTWSQPQRDGCGAIAQIIQLYDDQEPVSFPPSRFLETIIEEE
jgi:hypothetical protein